MIIHGIDFNFSTLDADDVDRMLAATERQKARVRAEGSRYTPEGNGYPEWVRFQCRLFMDYLDEVLGAGASEKLGLTGSNFNKCLEISKEIEAAMVAEKANLVNQIHDSPAIAPVLAPQNRAQRRQQKKHKPHSRSEGFHPAVVASPKQQTPEADAKAARRAELLRELNELENG